MISNEEEEEENTTDGVVPSVWIDQNVLKCTFKSNEETNKFFVIDNRKFEDELRVPENNFALFKMYATIINNLSDNNSVSSVDSDESYCLTSDELSDEEPSNEQTLDIHIQKVPSGVIINSNVYLTEHQWHTIVMEDGIAHCVVCDIYTDEDDVTHHMRSRRHVGKLNCFKPLAQFSLMIIRKIRNAYHCAVCNSTFDLKDLTAHKLSGKHTRNQDLALYKVIDERDNSIYNRNDNNVLGNRNNDNFNSNDEFQLSNSDGDYEDNLDDDNNDPVWSDDDVDMPGPSYADAIKKPALALPEDITVVVGSRNFKVKFDCWHMLIEPKPNRFYCMLCKDYGYISRKSKHYNAPEHSANLKKTEVVAKFEYHFIRQVDQFFHCGHCNSLQLPADIEDHLEIKHPLKTRMLSESSSAHASSGNNDTDRNGNDTLTQNVVQPTIMPKGDTKNSNNDTNVNGCYGHPFIGLYVVLNIFDCRMKVPLLNFNYLQNQTGHYYCGLCLYVCSEELVMAHIHSAFHTKHMQQVPYAVQFTYNLIRAIHAKMHCTLCNIFIPPNLVHLHIQELSHMNQLHEALGFNLTNGTNIEENMSNDKISIIGKENNGNSYSERLMNSNFRSASDDNNSVFGNGNNDKPTRTSDSVVIDADNDNDMIVTEDVHNDSLESVLDMDSHVYVKVANVYLKINFMSHNTMTVIGDDGRRYCFVCSIIVNFEDFKKHIESRSHEDNIKECKYVDLFEGNLLRQMHLLYHCGTCNVVMTRKTIKQHMEWPTHVEELEIAKNISKKIRKRAIKNGTQLVIATLQKETIYLGEDVPKCKILFNVQITKKLVRKHKIVMVNNDVFKVNTNRSASNSVPEVQRKNVLLIHFLVSFDNWHGILRTKSGGLTCVICLCDVEVDNLSMHTRTKMHLKRICQPFRQDCLSQLLRETTEDTLHCIPCNAELSNNKESVVSMHLSGKKHQNKYKSLKEASSKLDNNYDDCDDVIILQ